MSNLLAGGGVVDLALMPRLAVADGHALFSAEKLLSEVCGSLLVTAAIACLRFQHQLSSGVELQLYLLVVLMSFDESLGRVAARALQLQGVAALVGTLS